MYNRFNFSAVRVLLMSVVSLALFALSGCGPHTVPVSGKIVVDGVPAQDIRVVFQSAANTATVPPVAIGMTDQDGEYSLKLAESNKKGVVPGPYVVFLAWQDPEADENPVEGVTEEHVSPYKLPPRANSGELRFDVPDKGTSEANFEFDSSSEPTNVTPGV